MPDDMLIMWGDTMDITTRATFKRWRMLARRNKRTRMYYILIPLPDSNHLCDSTKEHTTLEAAYAEACARLGIDAGRDND
jgi:hypothetical protein